MRQKIKRGDPLRVAGGGVVYAISDETASGEVLVRAPGDLRKCVYLPVGDVLPYKPTKKAKGAYLWLLDKH